MLLTFVKLDQVSILPTFYEQLFHMKIFCAAFFYFQFSFVIFWQKNMGAKAARNMLVKLSRAGCIIFSSNIVLQSQENASELIALTLPL